ncbi:MAG: hypothetical protein RML72_06590 [Bacteroidia bacterium]|nr:hypothetical protein [Bacteroidia bacterium]MDW8158526.1 hypothetical protein [Bacteroidia bacterium]
MYATQAGKLYLQIYNQDKPEGEKLSAKAFFDKIIFPLFYNTENTKHLNSVHNSSFHAARKVKKEELEKEIALGGNESTLRYKYLQSGIKEAFVAPVEKLHAGTYVGYAAAGLDGTTAGQTSNIFYPFLAEKEEEIFEEEVYASWIGAGLGIGVRGGFCFTFLEETLLKLLAAGWKYYRQILNENPQLKGRQLDTWNGIWLNFLLDNQLINTSLETLPAGFAPYLQNYISKEGERLETVKWTDLFLHLSENFPNQTFLGYVYQYGQTNITVGYIPVYLSEIHSLIELFNILYGPVPRLKHRGFQYNIKNFIQEYESRFGIQKVCQRGSIGLYAFEPQQSDIKPNEKGEFKLKDKDIFILQQQILWLAALLVKQQNKDKKMNLFDLADKLAENLYEYQAGTRTTAKENEVLNLFDKKSRQKFIEGLADILKQLRSGGDDHLLEKAENFYQVVKEVTAMAPDRFPLFQSLVYFLFVYHKTAKN